MLTFLLYIQFVRCNVNDTDIGNGKRIVIVFFAQPNRCIFVWFSWHTWLTHRNRQATSNQCNPIPYGNSTTTGGYVQIQHSSMLQKGDTLPQRCRKNFETNFKKTWSSSPLETNHSPRLRSMYFLLQVSDGMNRIHHLHPWYTHAKKYL